MNVRWPNRGECLKRGVRTHCGCKGPAGALAALPLPQGADEYNRLCDQRLRKRFDTTFVAIRE